MTSKQTDKLQTRTWESTMEKPIKINGMLWEWICTAPHAKPSWKHGGKQIKHSQPRCCKIKKGYLTQELNHQTHQCSKLATLTLHDIILQKGQHNLDMINIKSPTANKVKHGKHGQTLYHKNEHCKEGPIVRQGEVDISGIVTAIESPGQLAINHNAELAIRLKQALVTLEWPIQ